MKWVVAALFDDLLDANDWVARRRLAPALNLVKLGAYNEQTGEAGNMQDARYESGLDNSPMYAFLDVPAPHRAMGETSTLCAWSPLRRDGRDRSEPVIKFTKPRKMVNSRHFN